jgi:hypothetical protein
MELNPGFYKKQDDLLLYAPNVVIGPSYELNILFKDTYNYPVEGWIWFDSELGAINYYNLLENNTPEI